jgi:hypothetical protein
MASRGLSLDDLARQNPVRVAGDLSEFVAQIWDSDEELDAFLADLHASRSASLA